MVAIYEFFLGKSNEIGSNSNTNLEAAIRRLANGRLFSLRENILPF